MNDSYFRIISILSKWTNQGNKIISNGTKLICNVPKEALNTWLQRIYGKFEGYLLDDIKCKLNINLPNDFVEFLSNCNGINIFSDSLSVWGTKASYVRTGDGAIQPYDFVDLNLD